MRARAFALLMLGGAACGTTDAPAGLTSGPAGRIRMVNLTSGTANAILEGVPFGVNLAFGASTPASLPAPSTALYSPILAGTRSLVLRLTADTSQVLGLYSLTITAGEDRTVYASGGLSAFQTVDDNAATALSSTTTRLRVVNHSTLSGPAVDVFITTPTAALATATAVATSVANRTASVYFTMAPGTWRIRSVRAGVAPADRDANVVSNANNQVLAAGTARTILLADTPGGGATPAFPATILLTDQ
jgi:hypothetical protein